jgi:hypothetical protein
MNIMPINRVTVRVCGEYACFTRPEMKVERVSYPGDDALWILDVCVGEPDRPAI